MPDIESKLDPKGLEAAAKACQASAPVAWVPMTCLGDRMTCAMPLDETVVEVMLETGEVCQAWYSCNIMEAGDWDFLPVKEDGEPDEDADSIAAKVVAWRTPTAIQEARHAGE